MPGFFIVLQKKIKSQNTTDKLLSLAGSNFDS